MNDQPRQKLCELIARHGTSLCEEAGRCEGYLRDYCPQHRGEVNVLVNALKERVAADLLNASESMPMELVLGRLIRRLEEHAGMKEEKARWAVESWALALGKITKESLTHTAAAPATITPKQASTAVPSNSVPGTASVRPSRSFPFVFVILFLLLAAGAGGTWYYFGVIAPKAEEMRKDKERWEWLAQEEETARKAKEKAEAEEKQKQMTAQAEAARLAKEKVDAEEKARAMAAEAERKRMAALDQEQRQKDAALVATLSSAGKIAPFTNSLGMKFVPAGTPGVLFSVWETRVNDFTAFVEDSGHDAISDNSFGAPSFTMEKTADGKGAEWAQKGGSWQNPHFPSKQTGEHPVVCVSYLDAEEFCAWLTKKDRNSGKIPATASYRLPSDAEWSRACGSSTYPWGESYPPKSSAGNYSGKEAMVGVYEGFSNPLAKEGYSDSAARTAPVGMFAENRFGLCDMGGNVAEWCSTWYAASMNDADVLKEFPALKDDKGGQHRVLRGASWCSCAETALRSSCRFNGGPHFRVGGGGFRVVLVVVGG